MEEDHFKELRYLGYATGALVLLFLFFMATLNANRESKPAYDECQNFCSTTEKEVKLFDDGVCICKDKK